MDTLSDQNTNTLLSFFERLTRFPRYPEDLMSDAFIRLIRSLGYHAFQDKAHNVILQLRPAPGTEEAPRLILQGHLDMVCLKERGRDHDFSTDPIRLVKDSEWLMADGTTLGADNTIGLAMMLALLSDSPLLPETRFIFTTGKENGMKGAKNLESRYLDAELLINLDAKTEGTVFTTSSKGSQGNLEIPIKRTHPGRQWVQTRIQLDGFRGGNAGEDILDVRSNAIKVLAEFLWRIDQNCQLLINSFSGKPYEYESVIPSYAQAVISFPIEDRERGFQAMNQVRDELLGNLLKTEPDARFTWDLVSSELLPMDHASSQRLLNCISMLPHGVYTIQAGTDQIESSNNLFSVTTGKETAFLRTSIFSASQTREQELEADIFQIMQTFLGTAKFEEAYPAWERKDHSPARALFFRVYSEMAGKEAREAALHSATECGIFQKKNPKLDLISIGPNIKDPDTLKERLSVESSLRTYKLLQKLIGEIVQLRRE